MVKLYSGCEKELGCMDYFFHLAKMQKHLEIPLYSPDELFSRLEAQKGIQATRTYQSKHKYTWGEAPEVTIRELFDPDVDNKFRVFWFIEHDAESTYHQYGIANTLYFFRRSSERIFFDEYYYLECYHV